MNLKLTTKEKLQLYYIELDTLESQVKEEVATEMLSGKQVMKKSRVTKYKIACINRAIQKLEKINNTKASMYEDWEFKKYSLNRELAIGKENLEELVEVQAAIQREIDEAYKLQMPLEEMTVLLGDKARLMLEILKKIKMVKAEIVHLEKSIAFMDKHKPEHSSRMSRYSVFMETDESSEANQTTSAYLPESLRDLARDVLSGKTREINLSGINTDVSAIYELQPGGDLELEIEETEIEKAERVEKAALLEREVELALEFQKKEKEKV